MFRGTQQALHVWKARCLAFWKPPFGPVINLNATESLFTCECILQLHDHVACHLHLLFSLSLNPFVIVTPPRMNWTGGRLKRHSKANGNQLLKSQKQYFAKARQQLQNGPGAAPPSRFSLFEGLLPSDGYRTFGHTPLDPRHPSRALKGPNRQNPSSSEREPRSSNVLSANNGVSEPISPVRRESKSAQILKSREEPNSLDWIKQKLLRNSDWAGLAVAKPLSITFTPAEEMERIGRRRKVTKEERRRTGRPFGQQHVHHNLIRPFDKGQNQSPAPANDPTDLSIRIGSNIHQTLTTKSSVQRQPVSPSHNSTAAEPMLLDKFERLAGNSPGKGREALFLAPNAENDCTSEGSNLVPLNEARDLKSFDEVLQRSSSIVRQVHPSSTPFADPRSHQQTPATNSRRGTSTISSIGSSISAQGIVPRLEAKKQTPPAAADSYTNYNHDHAEVNDRNESISQRYSGSVDSRTSQSKYNTKIFTSAQLAEPLAATTQRHPPKFTLDNQVTLEQELSERTNGRHHTQLAVPDRQREFQRSSIFQNSSHELMSGIPAPVDPRRAALQRQQVQAKPSEATSWMAKFQLAKEQHEASIENGEGRGEALQSRSGRVGDENEAWMKFVFPKDFGRIQSEFTFEKGPANKTSPNMASMSSSDIGTASLSAANKLHPEETFAQGDGSIHPSSVSAPTAANGTIFDPTLHCSMLESKPLAQTETDFLSRFSPMDGVLDERLGDVLTYNNAAGTERSFLSFPQSNSVQPRVGQQYFRTPARQTVPAKRTALYAFEESKEPDQSRERFEEEIRQQPHHPLQQHPQVNPEGLRTVHRAPLQILGNTALQNQALRSQIPMPSNGHREAVFPLAYSPASSQKSKPSLHSTNTSPFIQPLSRSSVSRPNGVKLNQNASSHGRQSLWHVSPGGSSDLTDTSAVGIRMPLLPDATLRTPLFGNDGPAMETSPLLRNSLLRSKPAVTEYM